MAIASGDDQGDYQMAFSHVGFFVTDMDRMIQFYSGVMGFFITDRGVLGANRITFFSRDPREHHQIVLIAGRDPATQLNINQISFRVKSLGELKAFYHQLEETGAQGMEPVIHGNSWSIYFRDPEGNRLEVFADTDWYISQPFKEYLDFNRTEEEIRAFTGEYCKTRAGYRPIAEWRAQMEAMMASGRPEPVSG